MSNGFYKTEHIFPKKWSDEFQQLSTDLKEIDKRIAQLQRQVTASSVSADNNEPLTPFSYQQIILSIFSESETVDNAVDNVRRLIDLGCDTNDKLRHFFSNSAVLELREQFFKIESDIGKAFTRMSVANIPIHHFFLIFGIRLEATKELLQNLATNTPYTDTK